MPQIHSAQIFGFNGFESLYDQLKVIDVSTQDVDIVYEMNSDGDVVSETLFDMSSPLTPVEVKKIAYEYDADGLITKETLTIGTKKYEKQFVYTNGVVTKEQLRQVTV